MGHCGNAWDTIILLKLLLWVWATQSRQATCIFGRGADDNKEKGHKTPVGGNWDGARVINQGAN